MLKNTSGSERTREAILLALLVLAVTGFTAYLAYAVNNKSIFTETTVGVVVFIWFAVVVGLSLVHANVRTQAGRPKEL